MARTRYTSSPQNIPLRALPAAALRAVWREGYGGAAFRADLMAGVVVGIVALPLAMALAIAVGVPPQHGLYTAIVAGGLVALLGGSRTQVTGPTAAFIVILAPIFARFGLAGLLIAGVLAGLILIAMGLFRMGKLIEFIPHPVTTGFTAGIATVIAFLQLKDLFGLTLTHTPEHFAQRVVAMAQAAGTATATRATRTMRNSASTRLPVVAVLSRSDATAQGATCWACPAGGGGAVAHGGGGGRSGSTVASVQA